MINIPNIFFDCVMGKVEHSEAIVLFVVLAEEDVKQSSFVEIPYSWFVEKTGLSKSTISKSIKSLQEKGLLSVVKTKPVHRYSSMLDLDGEEDFR